MASSLFQSAIRAGLRRIREITGEPMTYSRPGSSDIAIPLATPTHATREQVAALGFPVDVDIIDFLLPLAALAGLSPAEPRAEDIITMDDTGVKYLVVEPAGAACFERADPYADTVRIHTRQLAPEVTP